MKKLGNPEAWEYALGLSRIAGKELVERCPDGQMCGCVTAGCWRECVRFQKPQTTAEHIVANKREAQQEKKRAMNKDLIIPLIDKIESAQDDGSEGMPWTQDEIDLILHALRNLNVAPHSSITSKELLGELRIIPLCNNLELCKLDNGDWSVRELVGPDLIAAHRYYINGITKTIADSIYDTLRAQLAAVVVERDEINGTLDRIHEADMRGIELWRSDSPTERELIEPDRAQHIFWLMQRIDGLHERLTEAESRAARAEMYAKRYQWIRERVSDDMEWHLLGRISNGVEGFDAAIDAALAKVSQ